MRRRGDLSAIADRLRERLTTQIVKSQPTGEWRESQFPIRPEGAVDYSPRSGAEVLDISGKTLIGIDATTGNMQVGP